MSSNLSTPPINSDFLRLLHQQLLHNGFSWDEGKGYHRVAFYDHMNNRLSHDVIDNYTRDLLSFMTAHISDFKRELSMIQLDETMSHYLRLLGKQASFANMRFNGLFQIGMKENYTSLQDIDYIGFMFYWGFDAAETHYYMRIYLNPVDPVYQIIPPVEISSSYPYLPHVVKIHVYYNDIRGIVRPFLNNHLEQVSKLLGFDVDVLDDDIITLLDMIKIS